MKSLHMTFELLTLERSYTMFFHSHAGEPWDEATFYLQKMDVDRHRDRFTKTALFNVVHRH